MPTKAELEAELATLKANRHSNPADNYMRKVSPNLIITLHYAGKALWLALAAVFGVIGYKLYALGVNHVGNADATLPLGITFSLHDAGPGLIVMVTALLCSVVGAVKSKVELTPDAIRIMGRLRESGGTDDVRSPDALDTVTIEGIENLNIIWGLIEVAQLYRTAVVELVSADDIAKIARLQQCEPLPDKWAYELSSIVRASPRFQEWLRALPTRELSAPGARKIRIDPSLPWCVRLRWGARVYSTVDIFICTTAARDSK